MHSTLSLRSFHRAAFDMVPMFVWLMMALSCPFKEDCLALQNSFTSPPFKFCPCSLTALWGGALLFVLDVHHNKTLCHQHLSQRGDYRENLRSGKINNTTTITTTATKSLVIFLRQTIDLLMEIMEECQVFTERRHTWLGWMPLQIGWIDQ